MKIRTFFPAVVLLASVIVLTQVGCKKGDAGPPGPPGESTALEGFAPGIQCATCHSSEQDTTYNVAGRVYEWSTSKHAVGGDLERNGTDCAGCHTTEGFQERWRNNFAAQTVSQPVVHPSPPGCFACHSPHARNSFSLRDTAAVTLASYIVGEAPALFDYGKGNLCVKCHQPRSLSPTPDPFKTTTADTITINSSRWYAHYGVNGQMLMGKGGFKFSGYTYTGNSNHTDNTLIKQEGCPICHMAEGTYPPNAGTGKGGGHTMNIRYEWEGSPGSVLTGCKTSGCHASTFSSPDYIGASTGALTGGQGVQTFINRYLDTLYALMTDTNIVKKWNAGGSTKKWVTKSVTVVDGDTSVSYSVNASSSSPLKIVPASRVGALYNFMFLEHEGSHGAHNSRFAVELALSSAAELRKP